jgi:hypothetical protein
MEMQQVRYFLATAAMSLAVPANATTPVLAGSRLIVVAQAMIPRTGMMDAQNPMPMKERYLKRFPQPARVGDLIGMPVLDLYSKKLGYVRKVVRTPTGEAGRDPLWLIQTISRLSGSSAPPSRAAEKHDGRNKCHNKPQSPP